MELEFKGVCGSYASSSNPALYRQTPCVYVNYRGKHLVFDAGTGIISLGDDLLETTDDIFVCFSHFHFDHVLGFLYFKPLFEQNRLIYIVHPDPQKAEKMFKHIFHSDFFPITFEDIPATLRFISPDVCREAHSISITSHLLNHPGGSMAYELTLNAKRVIYATDNEITQYNKDQFVSLFKETDILIHDAYFFHESRSLHKNWGHSFLVDVLDLADKAQVKSLYLYHVSPELTSDSLVEMKQCVQSFLATKPHLHIEFAYEGLRVRL